MRTIHSLALCGLCLALGGCDSSPSDPAGPVVSQPAFGIEPQPFRVLPFAAVGTVDGRWTGQLGEGDLLVETRLARRLGATMGLVQS